VRKTGGTKTNRKSWWKKNFGGETILIERKLSEKREVEE
jgi:hypothetical protein